MNKPKEKEILGIMHTHSLEDNMDVYRSKTKNKYGYHTTHRFTRDKTLSAQTEARLRQIILRELL